MPNHAPMGAARAPKGPRCTPARKVKPQLVQIASINIDRMTELKWTHITEWLGKQTPTVIACAIQHHQLVSASHLDTAQSQYVPVFTEFAIGLAGGLAGGVGWVVHREWVNRITETSGIGEGPNCKWVEVDGKHKLVSVYIQPNADHEQNTLKLLQSIQQEVNVSRSVVWMGDANCPVNESCALAMVWKSACDTAGATLVDSEGGWGATPTRHPRGEQAGKPSHIDVIVASQKAQHDLSPTLVAIGTGTSLDCPTRRGRD